MVLIDNKRINDFCKKHPNFDIESTILTFIDFIEETYSTTVPSLDSNLASQILSNLKSLEQKVNGLDTTLSIKQSEYINKSVEIKKEYLEDVKNILMLNNNEKIVPIIKEYNEIFINKLSLLFKEIIPNEQQIYLQNILKNIENTITIEMGKGITKDSIDSMLYSIDQKFANILTHSEQKIANVLNVVSDTKKQDTELHTKLDEMLIKLNKNNEKGKISENMLDFNLQAVYPTAEIRNVANNAHSGDFWLIRKDKPCILVENKNHDKKVYADDVQKFIDDINTNNICGIMISQKTKIVHRENYEIEIHNGNVAVYIQECNYDPYKIKIAVQIIDIFKEKIEKQKLEQGTSVSINIETLQKINKEFQLFNIKRTQHIIEIKNMYETLTKSAEDMEFDTLTNFLESQGLLTNVKKFVCGKCPRTFKSQKGLETHERQCAGINNDNDSVLSNESLIKKGIQCKYCSETIPTEKGMKTHCIKKHKKEYSLNQEE
jgi:hypothetical protein